MACNTSILKIDRNCLNNAKGLLNLYLIDSALWTGSTLDDSITGGILTAVTLSGSAKMTEFVFPKKGANYTETATIEQASESSEYTQTITVTFARREKAKRQAFALLTAGLRPLKAIVKDYNGLYFCLGYVNNVNVSALDGGSEAATYTLTLTGMEPVQAPEVDSSIMASLVA